MQRPVDAIIWEADADTMRFSRIDGSVDEILGYSADDWLQDPDFWRSRLHPEDAAQVIQSCTEASRDRRAHRLTYRMLAADGRVVWMQDNVKVTVAGDRAVLSGVMIDVTELMEQRREVSELDGQNAHFRALFDLVPVAIWEEDWEGVLEVLRDLKARGIQDMHRHADRTPGFIDDMLSRLQVLSVNKSAVEMFRATSAEELIRRATEVFKADQPHSVFLTALDAVLRGVREIEGTTTLRRLDGGDLHVMYRIAIPDIEDRAPRVVICEMDVTAAQVANDRFELVTRATTDVIWDFDMVNDTLWASEGLSRAFGLDPAEMYNSLRNWTDRIHPDDLDGVMRHFDQIVHHGRNDWEQEYRFRRGDDTYAIVRDAGFILRDRAGRAVRMVGSLVDISTQRHLEEQLLQSRKMEAMGKLTGGMAHDFNNLLTLILGSIDALEEHVGDDDIARNHLAIAGDAIDRSTRLISQLMAYARQQPLSPRAVDLSRQVDGAMKIIQRALGESIEVVVQGAPGLWRSRVDPSQFDSALLNLCINARDAMPGGGTLKIGLRNSVINPGDPPTTMGLDPGRYVVVAVADTGHGMDATTMRFAFDPFFTTKDVGSGSGLGLSMVQGFTHQSRGLATIDSVLGGGTTVELHLPASDAGSQDLSEEGPGMNNAHAGTGRILLVEDQEVLREHFVAVLESLGYSVLTAEVASDAVEVLRSDVALDLLLTDIVLPGSSSGLDLARTAHELRPKLPVRFTSGYAETGLLGGSQVVSGRNLLRKPFRKQELAAFVREAIGGGG